MAFETSTDLIRQLQIALRKEAGVSSYDPNDPALPDLPSLGEAIAEADPSPPYLRCKQCRGRLLRGLQSSVCVCCGAQQRREIPPDPIPFKSTIGYRWLLESLDLTGSEAVTGNVSTERLSASKDSLVLSDLFDFELKWPSKPEKNESCIADKARHQRETSLNLIGVDLDSFFLESKKEIVPGVFDDRSIPNRKILSTKTNAFPSQESLSLFENAQTLDLAARSGSTKDFTDESFSGWESEFQSASSLTPEMSSSMDPTSGSFNDVKFINNAKNDDKARNDLVAPFSVADSWIQSDQRYNTNIGVSYDSEKFKTNNEAYSNGKAEVDSNNPSSMDDNWIPDELWPIGITKASNPQKINEDDDSFDTWQDFTSSASAPNLVDEHTLKTSLVNSRDNLQEKEVGSVVQPDLFSGPSALHSVSADSNSNVNGSISYREEAKTGGTAAVGVNSDENADAAIQSESADAAAEALMSQMHDLSFMLETELSIPKKTDGFDSIS